ncbi:hypothetical protein RRG08_052515 [Elysia crispata]|uniref:Uncharacterized protein n=1 Tax=Elysia crispata TaxID=231223 RepID=A0AAE0ZHV8_9GAST|nr:hypothetical protein RRG08_052515 [Elysia crispata]
MVETGSGTRLAEVQTCSSMKSQLPEVLALNSDRLSSSAVFYDLVQLYGCTILPQTLDETPALAGPDSFRPKLGCANGDVILSYLVNIHGHAWRFALLAPGGWDIDSRVEDLNKGREE